MQRLMTRMRNNRRCALLSVLLLFVAVLSSCRDDVVFYHYEATDVEGWEKNDVVVFEVPRFEESHTYSLSVGLRLSNAYPFRNLNVVVEQTTYPSRHTTIDTLSCNVADKHGFVLGKGISLYQYHLPARKCFYVHDDSLCIKIKHNMKREILPGISDVGIYIKKE